MLERARPEACFAVPSGCYNPAPFAAVTQAALPLSRSKTALLAACTLFALVACRLGPRLPDAAILPSDQDSPTLAGIWRAALAVEGGEVRLVFTEQQLTSFMASHIGEAERPAFNQAQIRLRDGRIKIYGVAELGPIEAGALIEVQPIVDPLGTIAFEITSAKLGPLPAPQAMLSGLSELLTEAFTGKLGPLATGIRITSLAIADGQVAIVGSLR